jgi:hypothetical protein
VYDIRRISLYRDRVSYLGRVSRSMKYDKSSMKRLGRSLERRWSNREAQIVKDRTVVTRIVFLVGLAIVIVQT